MHKQCTVKLFCCEFDVRSDLTSTCDKGIIDCLNLVTELRMTERMVVVVVVVV
jgi:hypothetical protein